MRLNTAWFALTVMVAGFVLPSSALAQDREGFWFGLGGGYGGAALTCINCESDGREAGGLAYFKLGWTLNPRILIGSEIQIWQKEVAIDTSALGSTVASIGIVNNSAILAFYPKKSSNFFVKGGVGLSYTSYCDMPDFDCGIDVGQGFGPILAAGTGYDIRLARRVAVTAALDYWYGGQGLLKLRRVGPQELYGPQGRHRPQGTQNGIAATLGVTFP